MKYCKDATDLDSEIDDHNSSEKKINHDIKLRAFADMIERVRQIPDRLTQAKIVNAWVNLFIEYDYEELDGLRPHRSLLQALKDGKGVCEEKARLKLYALERVGFGKNDIRCIIEHIHGPDKQKVLGHEVVEVFIDGKSWVMNLAGHNDVKNPITPKTAAGLVQNASKIETSAVHLNYTCKSFCRAHDEVVIPRGWFNRLWNASFALTDEPPQEAREAKTETTILSPEELTKYGIMQIMKSALSQRYVIS